ncbi:uncharacterized protein GlcG (DUF336 family) [Beijerinckia sp. GAS462]|nr:uncharacterized protein GlcG (DUF336 family) [Beijerinckia sp. GAS462]SEC74107.1 Uncharacterized conserved protein GlcG, DUF336 family [Beijerinckia sp. 28-YEA-48]
MKAMASRHVNRLLQSLGLLVLCAGSAAAQDATFTVKQLTLESALKIAQGALETCRKQGFQVAVAVVDRAGVTQVLLRDRLAGPHTIEVAANKAWTAVSFRLDTLQLTEATAAGGLSGLRSIRRFVAVGGGVPVEAGGSVLGAVGVSGGPGGQADDACARAGFEAVRADLEF